MKKQYKLSLEKKLTNMLIFMLKEEPSNKEIYLDIKNTFTFSNKSIFNLEKELKKIDLFGDSTQDLSCFSLFDDKINLSLFKNKKEVLFDHLRQIFLYCILFRNKEEGEKLLSDNEKFFIKDKSKKNEVKNNEIKNLIPGLGDNIGNLIGDLSEELIPKLSKMDLSTVDISNPMSILTDDRFKDILEETGVKLKQKMNNGDINEEELKSEIVNIMPDNILSSIFSNIAKK
jgi:hypothetical protein